VESADVLVDAGQWKVGFMYLKCFAGNGDKLNLGNLSASLNSY